ncbi:methylated-DNA--[protein]-cysteine S-methyltransferase [Rhodoferax sp. AJA081-3]|uniref:methylated-DNA--[protein]-cysteine S-methyltransferase n=1 Tax=Rhodoferax sp. AJA081-3 TaxID=2752316 RepID=UPI001AE08071|nr:methylated-DNA--[protein]-cysteine S-methyltransferase [Rhodoferax sp. AJA081-3]QTN27912.1 methylated-DNA--[protein]-cysteine S-methyltransferase [Rhodoferax sp. AJA081-3]
MKQLRTTVRCALTSPWGAMTLVAHEDALVWVGFDGQKHAPDTSKWTVSTTHPVLRMAADELQQYFAGERSQFDVPVDLGRGTPFQQRVWTALQGIEPGATTSYGAISQSIGNPNAVRAVGGAVGRNPISIIVPCHRVVGANGAMTGYAGGLPRKVALLQLESRL